MLKTKTKTKKWTLKAIREALSENVHFHMTYFEKSLKSLHVKKHKGITAVFSDIQSEAYNYAVNFKTIASLGELLQKFKTHGAPFTWWIGPQDKPKSLLPKLEALGLKQSDISDGMYLLMSKYKPKREGTVRIERVLKHAHLKDFVHVLSVFDEDILSYNSYWKKIPLALYGKEAPVEMYTGYIDGKPVTAGMLSFHGRTAGIYYISTLPEMRGKGLATEMLQFLLERVKELDYPVAVLQAAPEGKGIYSKAGFKTCCCYWEYMLP